MQIKSESEILKPEVRKQILKEIRSPENQRRKNEAYKRYLCYKDQTDQFVMEQLLKQLDQATVDEMSYCLANVSLIRKAIDKLARVYSNGVTREYGAGDTGSSDGTKKIQALEKKLEFNSQIKMTNKYLKLQKNMAFYVKPCPVYDKEMKAKWKLKLEPLQPYLYDAVEDHYDRTRAMAYILSDFEYAVENNFIGDAAKAGRTSAKAETPGGGNGKDEAIADAPEDAKTGSVIWWSASYHFTTDWEGNITSGEDNSNPIDELPIVNFAIDQDGQFWAKGGDDLIKGGILVNSVLTHNQHVGIVQGYGQFWMKGTNLQRSIKMGVNKAILMEYKKDEDAIPEIGYATASPQLAELRGLVEQYVALLLTTNNLSTSSVSSQLGGNTSAPSGVAMLIDKAESVEDVQDQRQIFQDKEPQIWRIAGKWLKAYAESLVDEFKNLSLPEDIDEKLMLKFLDHQVIMSESEKLQNLKIRKELGLDTMIALLMKDDPSLTEKQAEEKLKKIMEEKLENSLNEEEEDPEQVDPNADPKEEDDEEEVVEPIKPKPKKKKKPVKGKLAKAE